ncbi:MAG: winged helix-turn-helix domain-containing protein [Vicinamibacterales bacterium]
MTEASRKRFAQFEFAPSTGELWMHGRPVRIQRQPSRLLALLVARPGSVVSRDEIRQALWGEGTHVDFERSLNFCVAKLRSALRDDAASPRFVETVPTHGYRFIAPVQDADAAPGPAAPAPSSPTPPSQTSGSAWHRWAAAVAAVLLCATSLVWWEGHRGAIGPTIVVVPFHNETGTADLDRVAKGVSDAAVARLATPERLKQLRVIGNASDLTFSFKPASMKAMGDSLGAQYLLLGQMKKDDRRFRIVAHLIRVSDQTHLWAKTYDTDTLDLTQQSSIAEEIARSVAATLPRG